MKNAANEHFANHFSCCWNSEKVTQTRQDGRESSLILMPDALRVYKPKTFIWICSTFTFFSHTAQTLQSSSSENWLDWLTSSWLPAHIHAIKITKATLPIKLVRNFHFCARELKLGIRRAIFTHVFQLCTVLICLYPKKVLQYSLSSVTCTGELHVGIFLPERPRQANSAQQMPDKNNTEQVSAEVCVTFILASTPLKRRCSGARPSATPKYCGLLVRITCDVTPVVGRDPAEYLPTLHGCENGERGPVNYFTTKEWLHQIKEAGHYLPPGE